MRSVRLILHYHRQRSCFVHKRKKKIFLEKESHHTCLSTQHFLLLLLLNNNFLRLALVSCCCSFDSFSKVKLNIFNFISTHRTTYYRNALYVLNAYKCCNLIYNFDFSISSCTYGETIS